MSFVWINGQLVDKSEAKISVFDHGFLYGDGIWEHFRAFNGKIFRPMFGYGRFLRWSGWFPPPFSEASLIEAMESTLAANNRSEGYLRVILTRGSGTLGPDHRKLEPQGIIIAEEYRPFPDELYGAGIDLVSYRSEKSAFPLLYDHTLNQWDRVRAKKYALDCGCLDALFLDGEDKVHGTTEADLYVVRKEEVWRNRTSWDESFREFVHDIPSQLAHPRNVVRLELFDHQFALDADEAFLAGTSCGVIAVSRIDGKHIGSGTEGPITRRIREAYRKLTRGEA